MSETLDYWIYDFGVRMHIYSKTKCDLPTKWVQMGPWDLTRAP